MEKTERNNLSLFADRLDNLGKPNDYSSIFKDVDDLETCISAALGHAERIREFATAGHDWAYSISNRYAEAARILSCPDGKRQAILMIREWLSSDYSQLPA